MREDYALRYLGKLVDWNESKLAAEVGWLRRIAAYKFDSYQDFVAGERFISSLIRWLAQFDRADRDYAYQLLREKVVFLSAPEIQHLVRRTLPAHFRPILIRRVARSLGIEPYQVWATPESTAAYERLLHRSMFVGLSDGARMDVFRRASVGAIGNNQVVVNYELSPPKLCDLLKDLREAEKDETAKFEAAFLIDDFLGSGTTLCRQAKGGDWKGKIQRFGEAIRPKGDECFAKDFEIVTHHYIATKSGLDRARDKLKEFSAQTTNPYLTGKEFCLTHDLTLDDTVCYLKDKDPKLDSFLEKYYDPEVMTKSLWEGGCHVPHGFAGCGLALVLEHNTPNNSLGTLWAESAKPTTHHRMQPLFRRRQRHE